MGILQAILKEVRAIDPHPGVKAFLQTPPSPDPVNPDAYIILDGATGAWNGHDDEVARWDTIVKVWRFDDFSAANTHIARVEDPGGLWYYDPLASEWVQFTLIGGALHTLSDAVPLAAHFGIADPGTSIAGSRSDHVHTLGDPAAPLPVSRLPLVGTGSAPAKDDHVHAHGDHGEDGGLHAVVSITDAGFMSPAHKATLEATGPLTIAVDPEALDLNTVNDIGVATEGARADHVHEVLAPSSQPTNIGGTQPGIGTSAASARADHVHAISTGLSQTVGQGNDQGSGTAIALANHVHAHGAQPADGNAHMNATTSLDGFQSKEDKTKLNSTGALGSSTPPVVNAGTGSAGNSSEAARANHTHDVSTSTASPVSVHSSSGTAGSSNNLARSDHRHAHGNLSGGGLHGVATQSSNGFISSTDKKKLDEMPATTHWAGADPSWSSGNTVHTMSTFVTAIGVGPQDWTKGLSSALITCQRAGTYVIRVVFDMKLTGAVTTAYTTYVKTYLGAAAYLEKNVTFPVSPGDSYAEVSISITAQVAAGGVLQFTTFNNSGHSMKTVRSHLTVTRLI